MGGKAARFSTISVSHPASAMKSTVSIDLIFRVSDANVIEIRAGQPNFSSPRKIFLDNLIYVLAFSLCLSVLTDF